MALGERIKKHDYTFTVADLENLEGWFSNSDAL